MIKWVIGGGVLLAGGFAFWVYHREQTAAAAKAAAAAATAAAAPHAGGGAPVYVRAAGALGGFVGSVAGHLLPVPGLAGAAGAYAGSLLADNAAGVGQAAGGVKALVTGHPLDAAKGVGGGVVKIAAAPVKGLAHAISSIF